MDNDWCIGGIILAFCLLLVACTRPRKDEHDEDAAGVREVPK